MERQTILPKLLPPLSPRLMLRAFRIVRRRFRAGEFDRVYAIEVANLIPLRLQPDVLDARNLPSQRLDPVQGLVLVILGSRVLPFVDHDVDHRLGLSESV